jgi:ribosomal protein S1
VRKGDKLMGVIVSKNDFGYVVASFGGIKGMINFEDVEEKLGKNYDKNEFKTGSILKAYVLFKKKDKGCALTLSKKKAKADREEGGEQAETIETAFLPNDEEMEAIVSSDKYSTMMKASRDPEHVG